MAFNLFPYGNLHKLNLDWVIKTIREAKEALDQAAQTVTGYESRLAAVESSVSTLSSSVNLLRGTVSGHTIRLDQAQSDIANHTQQINSLDTRLGLQNTAIQAQGLRINQAQSDIANHTQQITQLGENVAGKVDVRNGKAANLRFVTVTGPEGGTIDENTGIQPTVVAGLETALALHPITNGVLDSQHYAKVYVGSPEQESQATTKGYVDNANTQTLAALANKVDNLNGKAARLTLAAYQESGPSNQYGVRIDANPGTRTGLEFHPINNGVVDTSVFAELSVGDPTAATSAATKRYVDGRTLTPYTYDTKAKWDQAHPDNLLETLPSNSIVTILSSMIHPADVPGSISGVSIYGSVITIQSETVGATIPKHQIFMDRNNLWIRFLPGSTAPQNWYKFAGISDPVSDNETIR